jgi:hypothetical protein
MAAPATSANTAAEIMEMLLLDFIFICILRPTRLLLSYHALDIDAGVLQHHTPLCAERAMPTLPEVGLEKMTAFWIGAGG